MPTPKKGARLGGSPAHQKLILSNLAALGMTLKDSVMPSFGDSESAAIFSDDQSI